MIGEKRVNIYDVAKEAGVSPATVSRVLNNYKNVKEETRKKVLEIIEGKDFVPNAAAQNLSVGATKNVAFIAPDIENPFFAKILHGLSDQAMEYGYNVFMFGTDENIEREHQVLDVLKSESLRGLIMIPVVENNEKTIALLLRLEAADVPIVLLDRDIIGADFDGVFSKDEEGAFEAVKCLIQAGHTQIATVAGPKTSKPGYERQKGYERALSQYGIPMKTDYIADGDFTENGAYFAMQKLMQMKEPPTAIFAANNMATLGCLKYMKEHEIKLGRDISIVGFDEIRELTYTDINLTVVDRPIYDMGRAALKLLQSKVEKKDSMNDSSFVQKSYVKTTLIKRGSEYCDKLKEYNVKQQDNNI